MLKPNLINHFFPGTLHPAETKIKTTGSTVIAKEIAFIPIFQILMQNHPKIQVLDYTNTDYFRYTPECVAFNFHDFFDGVIGINILKDLHLNIDVTEQIISDGNIIIPFLYRENSLIYNEIKIKPLTKTCVKLPIQIKHGTILIHEQNPSGLLIKEGITTVKDNLTSIIICNSTNEPRTLKINEITYEQLNKENHEIFNLEQFTENFISTDKPVLDLKKSLRIRHLNPEEKTKLYTLCTKYKDLFHKADEKLTATNKVCHAIRLTDEIPTHPYIYKYPHVHKELVRETVEQYLRDGIIRHSQSPYNHPIWIVDKKLDASGKKKFRMVIDYSALNEKTIDDRYPIPDIDTTLAKLGKSQYFTTIDLASGYHQILMHSDSIEKTAFSCDRGHYEFLRMPFGLKTAPSTFQRVMDHILRDLIKENICMVYLDDIIVYSISLQEHMIHLKKVFEALRQANLKIQLDKTEFLQKSTEYLGHIITDQGVKPNPKKIVAIKNLPIPKTVTEIKSFLGLTGYYRKFIKDYAKIAKPMTAYLKKGSKIDINNTSYKEAFNQLKNYLTNEPILIYPDFSIPFELTTDASNYAIGAVLSQNNKPIAYASRTLNKAEQNYSVVEKEMLSIINFCAYFRPYLYGKEFTIFTDHRPLKWLTSIKEPNSRLLRWKIKMQDYNYKEIKYIKGGNNKVADTLSRIKLPDDEISSLNGEFDPIDQPKLADFNILTDELELIDQNPENKQTTSISAIDQLINETLNDTSMNATPSIKVLQDILLDPVEEIPLNETDNETIHSAAENPVFEIQKNPLSLSTIRFYFISPMTLYLLLLV